MNDAFPLSANRFMSLERRYIAFRLGICSREVGGIREFPVSSRRTDNRTEQTWRRQTPLACISLDPDTSVLRGVLLGWRLLDS